MNLLRKATHWYFSKSALPYWCILVLDSLIILLSSLLSYYAYLGGNFIASNFWWLVQFWLCTLPVFLVGMRLFHTYSGILRYSSFADLLRVSCALVVGYGLSGLGVWLLRLCGVNFSHTISLRGFIMAFFASMILMWGVRILVKYLFDRSYKTKDAERVFIYGIREGGIAIAKSMRSEHPLRYLVKGFVCDEPEMQGRFLVGTNVYAPDSELIRHMNRFGARMLFVSPTCSEQFREHDELITLLTKAGIKIMMMPSAETWDGHSELRHQQLHEVDIEDLLPRDKIQVDLDAIGAMLRGKRILITGAAGSIGSEMVRQVAQFAPAELVLIDQAETPMHDVRLYMARHHADIPCWTIVGSISNPTHMEQIFREHRPEYVFHAAAYKHVPMMEDNPAMAVQNNIYGTRVIADLAVKYGTRKFVMISTDKAVNPTNVMGCSKRICEIYCQSLNAALQQEQEAPSSKSQDQAVQGSKSQADVPAFSSSQVITPLHKGGAGGGSSCQFITTRFGNVLGSNGSVIPIFREQIRRGGPVTVTHPDIIRYFMLIPEACQLVLEAGTMGHGGEIFVFDMGKPVRIADLAQRMIDLSGAHDVQIKFTGLRDGEKLYEEVLNDAEQTRPTVHPKIKVAAVRQYPYEQALANEEELYRLSFGYDDMAIVRKMKEIVPEYKSRHSKYEALD